MKIQDIIKTKDVIKISPDQTLSSALSYLSSSHDAAFVFSEDKKFLGVINPYHCLIKTSYPGNAKVEHCLFHVPRIRTNFPISKVAQLMIESKVHYLPVFDEKDMFLGIISARRLLSVLRKSGIFNIRIGDFLKIKNHPVITSYENDVVSEAIHIFKTRKISKLVIIGRDMKLKGVLTYYDLIRFLITPKKRLQRGDREGNRVSLFNQHVKNFVKTYVLTLGSENTMKDALDLILDKAIGSVVIIDQERVPIGVVTTRDFLQLLIREGQEKKVEVITKNLSKESRRMLGGFFNLINLLISKIPNVAKARLFVKEEKGGHLFEGILSLIPKRGSPKVIKREGKSLQKVLYPLKNFIKIFRRE